MDIHRVTDHHLSSYDRRDFASYVYLGLDLNLDIWFDLYQNLKLNDYILI